MCIVQMYNEQRTMIGGKISSLAFFCCFNDTHKYFYDFHYVFLYRVIYLIIYIFRLEMYIVHRSLYIVHSHQLLQVLPAVAQSGHLVLTAQLTL